MILTIDAGNTNITLAGYSKTGIAFIEQIKTDKTADRATIIRSLSLAFDKQNLTKGDFSGSILSCVVPAISEDLTEAVKALTDTLPIVVKIGLDFGLKINIDTPSELGSDIICDNVAAQANYTAPLIIANLGTATTISATNEFGDILGCSISPGVALSFEALIHRASHLYADELKSPPDRVIGANTISSIKSGIIYGYASLVDGMAQKIQEETGKPATIIITGGNAPYIVPYLKSKVAYEPNLILDGLYILYHKNKDT